MNIPEMNKLKDTGNEAYFFANISNKVAIDYNYNGNKISKKFYAAEPDKCETGCFIKNIPGTQHYVFVKDNAVIMYDLIQKVTYSCSKLYPQLKKISEVSFFLFQDLLNQLMKEEQYLFPYIKQTIKDTHGNNNAGSALQILKEKIHQHQNEHKRSLKYLKILRQLTDNYRLPHNSCNSYKLLCEKMEEFEDDLHTYFYLENNILLKCLNLAEGSESKEQ
ncbi:MAG: hemerythrin domain-containing protein [Parafilimonas sp.]